MPLTPKNSWEDGFYIYAQAVFLVDKSSFKKCENYTVCVDLNGYGPLPKGLGYGKYTNLSFLYSSWKDGSFLLSFFLFAGTVLFDEKIHHT